MWRRNSCQIIQLNTSTRETFHKINSFNLIGRRYSSVRQVLPTSSIICGKYFSTLIKTNLPWRNKLSSLHQRNYSNKSKQTIFNPSWMEPEFDPLCE